MPITYRTAALFGAVARDMQAAPTGAEAAP